MSQAAAELPMNRELDGLPTERVLEGLASLHQLVFVANRDGRIVWMSDALGAICDPEHTLLGRDLSSLRPHQSESVWPLSERLRRDGVLSKEAAELSQGRDGSMRVEISAFWVGAESDDRLLVAIVRPMDEENREERAEAVPSEILDALPEAVFATDRLGFISYVNRGAEELTRLPRAEILGKPMALFLNAEQGFGRFLAGLSDGGFGDVEFEFQDPGGQCSWFSVTAKARLGADGEPSGSFVYIRNITERKRLHQELQRKNEEVQSYVHTVSHDLRSPLVSVLGFARLLRADHAPVLDTSGLHFLDRIEEAGRTMEALIESLLELSRIGTVRDHPSFIDPRSVLLQLQAELKPRLEEQHIRFEFAREAPLVHCDRTRLYQLLSNLVGNALDHMGPAEDARIEVGWSEEPGWVHFTVRDNGRGIAPIHHDRIFEVFQTLGHRDRSAGSTGIGLAIVEKIVGLYGGRVWVESDVGEGACFGFTLPRA